MSSLDTRNINSQADYSRSVNLALDVKKAISGIKINDDFWNVTWKGYTFSIKPYLCCCLSFIKHKDLFNPLLSMIINSDGGFFNNIDDLTLEKYDSLFTDDENNVYESIFHKPISNIPCVAKYVLGNEDVKSIRKILFYVLREFNMFYNDNDAYVRFTDETLCNTEAFSYYLSMYWAIQKSKKIQMLLIKEIKTIDFSSLLETLCPEESAHYKYISGEITSKQLLDKYLAYSEDNPTPIIAREFVALFDSSSDDCISFAMRIVNDLDFRTGFLSFIRVMSCSYFTHGFFDLQNSVYDEVCKDRNMYRDDNSKLIEESKDLKNQIKALKRDISSLTNDLETKVKEFDTNTYKNKIKSLESEISSLKKEISSLTDSLSVKDDTILKQKQVISKQIKDIKSLNASLDKLDVSDGSFDESISEVSVNTQVSLGDMLDKLRNYKIAIFGGYDSRNLESKFEGYGLNVKQYIDESSVEVGNLDCAVILASNVSHHLVRHLESKFNGKFLYFNGTNIELMVSKLYEILCMEE